MESFSTGRLPVCVLFVLLAAAAHPGASKVWGADPPASGVPELSSDQPIHISADEMEADNRKRTVVFMGNVKVVQDSLTIDSRRLEITYTQSGEEKQGLGGNIDTITALEEVIIHFGTRVATTDKAEYRSVDGVLTLTGPGSKVVDGENSITGSRITLYRNSDRITVEGGKKERVKAVFFPSSRSQN
ncbi:MAG: lipopolysaccharide transport periplasmic protein LptA [Desulfobacterales bacterium]|jgi:lipopolysaccharide export system protein LptA